ncbi:putative sister chromatid cohesion protein Ctf8 [Teratosphaeria nubilosa]|uniref:Putative sister chromatid cohesion protein Ctf8 n=1 Tax=Teratosphaeria nubilosa TaxID=161662 RepID=A0A6G1L580_9PEZI|nr:putative sister chromatid cohesion protein Ctf8 [Teratosphaeria nubilosa]
MPSIPLHPPAKARSWDTANSLPQLLQTPSGLAIVEIQGTINSTTTPPPPPQAVMQNGMLDGSLHVGKLMFPLYDPSNGAEDTAWHKRVYLYVGRHQRVTGEVKKLAKPLAVVRRKEGTRESEELEVAEIIFYKILFAHRPEPVGQNSTVG